jgi:hypothetical protein
MGAIISVIGVYRCVIKGEIGSVLGVWCKEFCTAKALIINEL